MFVTSLFGFFRGILNVSLVVSVITSDYNVTVTTKLSFIIRWVICLQKLLIN